ncbi:hypothetical protein ACFVUR_09530 [Stenotrophomonas bentonitica]|jgi:hypothetical protein|uniref:hypothetical protein n=1 Tax=Stenotrophomonas bentonitica TaxID=1450134 RepID=UPI000C9B4D1D|nr:hypothetical protein [Stenotrophomonas bentonitica]
MKIKMAIGIALVSMTLSGGAAAQQYVNGYTRADGTYVNGHYRSQSNSTKLDNYSTQGNQNPYNGRNGTVDPYKPTSSNPYGSPYNQPRTRQRQPTGYGY